MSWPKTIPLPIDYALYKSQKKICNGLGVIYPALPNTNLCSDLHPESLVPQALYTEVLVILSQ